MISFLKSHFVLSVSFALLQLLAWPAAGFAPLLFIAWLPLLQLQYRYSIGHISNKQFFGYTYLAFMLFNVAVTWWVYYASLFGVVMAVLLNALFMTCAFMLFGRLQKRFKHSATWLLLIPVWITWEWLHLDWDLSWPWLTMGNGLAKMHTFIQWYCYTGVFGGTLWILLINLLLFGCIHLRKQKKHVVLVLGTTIVCLVSPIAISYYQYRHYTEKQNPVNVVVMQPNIDPYNEKFNGLTGQQQLEKMMALTTGFVDSTTDYLIGPETSIPYAIWENELNNNPQIAYLKRMLQNYPRLSLITGAATDKLYENPDSISTTARKFKDTTLYYDTYNTALQIDSTSIIALYHKSKLVPGVEKMPFPQIFKPIEKLAINLGGSSGSLGIDASPNVFKNNSYLSQMAVAPIICYESIYGAYVAEYVKKGAAWLCIITNDGWWYDTPGYKQHILFGRLRAIEMRRSIARSANTGISAIINQRGDILQQTGFWQPSTIKATLQANNYQTFYCRHGDYLAHLSACITLLSITCALILKIKN
jgi:apolipoprotein N-acyltransferase